MPSTSQGTDSFLDAVKTALLASDDLAELSAGAVAVWHHGESDPDESIQDAISKCKGVACLIYDLGGTAAGGDADVLTAEAAVELYVSTPKRSRKVTPSLRLGGEIRDSIMRCLHRHPDLRNTAAYFDTRVQGYAPLADPEFTAWRITLTRSIYLSL